MSENKSDKLILTVIFSPKLAENPIMEVWRIGTNWIVSNNSGELVTYNDRVALLDAIRNDFAEILAKQ